MKQVLVPFLVSITSLGLPGVAFAQELDPAAELAPLVILSTLLYGLIGIALCIAGYFAFDRLIGLDLRRELVEDQNEALGLMLAGVFIGIAIVVAAAIR